MLGGGGIIRCTVLRLQDAPQYIPGLITVRVYGTE